MVVAAIPFRDSVLQAAPSGWVIAAGIAFHQWADFSWALVFFGVLGRWTARLSPLPILLIGLTWAALTSALEWAFLVPAFPFWQPIFTLRQAYWVGFIVHATSASMYPLFPYIRDRLAGYYSEKHRRFAYVWTIAALAGLPVLGTLAFLGSQSREVAWLGHNRAYDQSYMRRMAAHHRQGVEISDIGAAKATDPHLRALARMMTSGQNGEIAILAQWWRSWFPGEVPDATPDEHRTMPGIIGETQIANLRQAQPADFDRLFVSLMSAHHQGAIDMAYDALGNASDPRLKIMAYSIGYEQRGEINLMRGTEAGLAAVEEAFASLCSAGTR
ncbi:MAG: hypothetical protein QOF41_329 [Methylobacteriaceae bacterium]|nr:hypothetical protein [Methylobacteriaceae bacterium]